MKLEGNTILITGGTSGIGLELAAEFIARGNTVIVTGRSRAKLDLAIKRLPKLVALESDVADPLAIAALGTRVTRDFPELNVVINNAGIMRKINLHDPNHDLRRLTEEVEINLMGPMRVTSQFLAHLKTRPSAAIVNVSSALAFTPLSISPIYSATKAGLHSYTQALRRQLRDTNVRVFELSPPGIDTPLLKDEFTSEDLGGVKSMDVRALARATMRGLEKDQWEIRPGVSRALGVISRLAPDFAVNQLGKSVDHMLRPKPRA